MGEALALLILPPAIFLQVANFAIICQIHLHHGFLGVSTYYHSRQMITQQPPKGPAGIVKGHPQMAIFQTTHAGVYAPPCVWTVKPSFALARFARRTGQPPHPP